MRTLADYAYLLRGPSQRRRSTLAAYLMWLFAGSVGGHRLYLGKYATAAAQLSLFTAGLIAWRTTGLGLMVVAVSLIWSFVDVLLLPGYISDHNRRLDAGVES